MTMNDADSPEPVAIGDEARNITFGKGGGYDASQVDDLLDRIAAELDAGRPAGPLIANATFQKVSRRGYDTAAVDWFLDQLRRRGDPENADPWRRLAADPYCIRRKPGELVRHVAEPSQAECKGEWHLFTRPRGTHLSWVTTGALRHELRTTNQKTVASSRGGLWTGVGTTFTAGGRTFTWKRVTRSSWPGIAGTISHDRPDMPAHTLDPEAGQKDPLLRQLRDETGIPVLYAPAGGFGGYIKFPGQRWLRFPVRGTERSNAIMTAVDQAGNKVARYRLIRCGSSFWRRTTEITLHPDQRLTDELALAIAASAPWLSNCFGDALGAV